jgi:predicted porin
MHNHHNHFHYYVHPAWMNAIAAFVLLCACSVDATAQSTVTIYGRIVAGINYQSNQNTGRVDASGTPINGGVWSAGGNEWGTSFFGFTGDEDLGGGLKANFTLENGFSSANGVPNGGSGLWNRRSTVGFSGAFGTLKFGRDLALPSDVVWSMDPTGQQAMSTATLVKGRNWPITSNQIQYTTPSFNGFYAQGMVGLGGVAGSTKDSSSSAFLLAYTQAGLELKAMFDVANDPTGQYSSLFQYSKEFTVGGTYTLDNSKFFLGYQNLSAPAVAASLGNPDQASHFWLGINYTLTPALTLIGAGYHVNLNQNTGSANLFMVGTNYNLSKRTLLYASLGTLHNSALTSFAIETGNSAPGVNQSAFYTGVSHSF